MCLFLPHGRHCHLKITVSVSVYGSVQYTIRESKHCSTGRPLGPHLCMKTLVTLSSRFNGTYVILYEYADLGFFFKLSFVKCLTEHR
jgi:hypothetical protein